MNINFKSNIVILTVVLVVLASLLGYFILWFPKAANIQPVSDRVGEKASSSSSNTSASSRLVFQSNVSGSAALSSVTKKTFSGVFRSLSGDRIFVSNASEDTSFGLGLTKKARLTTVKERSSPKEPPSVPEIKDIELKDLVLNDQITLFLEDTGGGFVITQIEVTRSKK